MRQCFPAFTCALYGSSLSSGNRFLILLFDTRGRLRISNRKGRVTEAPPLDEKVYRQHKKRKHDAQRFALHEQNWSLGNEHEGALSEEDLLGEGVIRRYEWIEQRHLGVGEAIEHDVRQKEEAGNKRYIVKNDVF